MPPPPWPQMPVLRHGAGGAQHRRRLRLPAQPTTRCSTRALRALPPVFVVRPPDGPRPQTGCARTSSTRSQQTAPRRSAGRVPTRLPELLLVEVLRLHLASRARGRPRLDGRAARPRARARAGRAARGAGTQVDGRRPRRARRRVPLAARRPVPRGARPLADPLPDRVAHARRRRTCSRPPTSGCSPSRTGSATSPRRRSAARSSANSGCHRRLAGELPRPTQAALSRYTLSGPV